MANAPPSPPPPAGEIINEHSIEISQNSNKTTTFNSIDDIVERYMLSSTTSLLFPFFASLAWIFDSQQTFINVFSDTKPSWRCTSPTCNVTSSLSTPCNLPSSSWSFSDSAVMCSVKTESEDLCSAVRMLWEKRWALRRLLAIVIASFGIGVMYYGMPLNLGNLNANLYITVALNAVVELLSTLVIFYLAGEMSRRRFMVGLMVVSGGCSLACTAVGGWLAVAVELLAFSGVFTAFAIFMVYTVELFPTCVRNSALAVMRQAVVLGGVVAPAIVAVGRGRKFLSFAVFGIVIIFCAIFIVILPETRGRGIGDTMEEEESKMVMEAKGVIIPPPEKISSA